MKSILVPVAGLAACATASPLRQVFSTDEAVDGYPGALHDPRDWPESFMVRQSIDLRARRGDCTVEGRLDAVMQKQGDTLIVVGLGPMNVRAFTLTQRGHEVELVRSASAPELPFSPRYILVDVHRVFFTPPLPRPRPGEAGVVRGELDGEQVEERWDQGELRSRSFTRPGTSLHGAVRVEYGAGCRADRCHPESVTVHNEWYGYTLAIASSDYEALD